MFEKEAIEFSEQKAKSENFNPNEPYDVGYRDVLEIGFMKGAELGYNKANEWNIETPSSVVSNKDLLLQVEKDDFVVGYYHFEKKRFYTNDGQEVIPLAWKEIHYPQESEK